MNVRTRRLLLAALAVAVVTLLVGGRRRVTSVRDGAGGPRVWLINRLADQLRGLRRGDLARASGTYRPARVAIVSGRQPDPPDSRDQTLPWPLRQLAPGQHVTCTVLTGPDAQAAERLAGAAPSNVRWHSGGAWYLVVFRPLLPDERDCAEVGPR